MAFITAGEVINRVASEVGLDELADPYVSQDQNFTQLRRLLQSAAGDLLNMRPHWPHLVKLHTIATVGGQVDYTLPSDFRGMINETGWNNTTRLPLAGPASPTQWRRLVVWGGTSYTFTFRLTPQKISVYPAPAAGVGLTFEYLSDLWVQSESEEPTADKAAPTVSTDTVLFDDLLIVRALKLKHLQAKGFDTTVAVAEYASALEAALSRAGGAPRLTLNCPTRTAAPVADAGNGVLY